MKHKHFGYKLWGKAGLGSHRSNTKKRIIRSENRKDRQQSKKDCFDGVL